MACAICKEKPPPLDPKRLKKLQSRPRPPPEVDNDDVIAAEQLQREIYEAEDADDLGLTRSGEPEFGRSMSFPIQGYLGFRNGNSSPGFPHRETHPVPDLSAPHVEPHHSESLHALGGTELHGDDEALARAVSLSLGNEVHEPSHSEDPIHAIGNHSSFQDTSGDFALAMALSLQGGLDHRSQLPSPGLEHGWSEPDTSQDEHFAREIERQINEQNSEQVAREIERQLNEQNSEQVAREIERQLNEQNSEQVAQQIQRQLNEQASPWPQPIPHRYPQSTPPRYPQPTPQAYPRPEYAVHPSGVAYPGAERYPYLQSAHPVHRRPNQQHLVGQPYYIDEYQSRGGWPGAFHSIQEGATGIFQRGTNHFMDESVIEKLRNAAPQLLIFAGLILYLYFHGSKCSSCAS
ncbi:hypothetical protein PGT21_002951 [Puccinia graminis f. sp. tritici]|uniref:Uncharacterized protein n=1 Tax=Puccinia graminis f. sp. tritici TaxID=56615 RepID=A0A5B0NXM3_PUCGR|nr:hypothetical protein PGT21_002951 [Puccinia graminis f. sp. tritici]KAA1129963.1 hypothetical protein PGTUg99_002199 [Puccinia graminis f. sp. tritici]